jgi:arginyl-tRNA synthetase
VPENLTAGIRLNDKEVSLIQMIADFPNIVQQAAGEYSPSVIANYTYDLVKEYNQFYHDYSILKEEDQSVKEMRLLLSQQVAKVVKTGMNLLGIEVPERM